MRAVSALVAAVALAGCGVDPRDECKETAAASCRKLFECWTTDADRARLMLGKNADECVTISQARCEPPAPLCEVPKVWDGQAAAQCASGLKALKCTEVRAGTRPSSCTNTCK